LSASDGFYCSLGMAPAGEGLITKAFRIKKAKTVSDVETEIDNAANLIKPISEGGRGGLLYCFIDAQQKTEFLQQFKIHARNKFGLQDIIGDHILVGGSTHTKTSLVPNGVDPPDIDAVSYISKDKMQQLYEQNLKTLIRIRDEGIVMEVFNRNYNTWKYLKGKKINREISRYERSYARHKQVRAYQIKAIVEVGGVKQVHSLDLLWKDMPILNDLALTDPLFNRIDVSFYTLEQASNGRSIPPETKLKF
jgi:hypothetical protein